MKTKKINVADKQARQRLILAIFTGVGFIILSLVIVLFAIIDSFKTVQLDILVAPKDSEITLNGNKYKNGTYRVEPGEYEVVIKHAELEPYTAVMDFEDGEEVKLYLYLTGPDGDMSWYLAHNEDDLIVTSIGDYYADLESQAYVELDPIFAITPYYDYNNGFKVNAEKGEGEEKVKVIVYLYTCDDDRLDILKQNATKWINEQQIDLNNYILTYKYCE